MIESIINEFFIQYGLLGLGWILYFWERYARSKEQERFQKLAVDAQTTFQSLVSKMVMAKRDIDDPSDS